jgi:cytoskeletal protein CcmA (bactofilin family)
MGNDIIITKPKQEGFINQLLIKHELQIFILKTNLFKKLRLFKLIEISGNAKGNIDNHRRIAVLGKGKFEGNIKATSLEVAGKVYGNIEANNLVVYSTGYVCYDKMNCKNITVYDGGRISKAQKAEVNNPNTYIIPPSPRKVSSFQSY